MLQNSAILINHESFFQEKETSQLYRSQFFEIKSLMAETIKNQFSKKISCKQISVFGNNLLILENWNGFSCRESFF